MNILITAPHACSVENAAHVCDVRAHDIAQLLQVYLEMAGHQVSSIVNPTTRRDQLDVNRVEGRNHPYRRAIDQLLPLMDLLIDVHSFPSGEPRFRGHDIVIFNLPSTFDDAFVRHVVDALGARGVRAVLYDGSSENDTVASALERGKMAVLIEFNEGDDCQGAWLVQLLAQGISTAAREALT